MRARDIRIVDVDRARLRETIDALERAEDIDAAWHAYVLASLGEDAEAPRDRRPAFLASVGVALLPWALLIWWLVR